MSVLSGPLHRAEATVRMREGFQSEPVLGAERYYLFHRYAAESLGA